MKKIQHEMSSMKEVLVLLCSLVCTVSADNCKSKAPVKGELYCTSMAISTFPKQLGTGAREDL